MEAAFIKSEFSSVAIKKAAYVYINKFSIDISIENDKYLCRLNFNESLSPAQQKYYLNEFKKEVLDQELRESIKKETEDVRNLILAHAFSKTNLIDE